MNIRFLIFLFLLLISLIIPQEAFAQESCSLINPCETISPALFRDESVKPQFPGQKVCIYYFWGAGCKNCQEIEDLINNLEKNYQEKAEFKKFEIYFDSQGRDLFYDFVKRYQVENPGVPSAFLGNLYLGGKKAIEENLEAKINEFYKEVDKIVCPLDYNRIEEKVETPKKLSLTLPTVILAALADSINPCAFAVLIFLLVYLISLKAEKRILKVGLTYIGTVFLIYFLAGMGLLTFLKTVSIGPLITKIAAALAIIAGLINIKDFFWYGKGISLQIPKSKKPLIEKYVRQASIPAAFVLGILVSAFELPCTGGIYLAILSLLATQSTQISTIPYLFLYNFIFVLPLFFIVFLVYKGINPERLEKIRVEKRKLMRLVMGLVLVGLGITLII